MYEENKGDQVETHISDIEAKGGSRSRMTRNILVVSLALIVILFIIAVGVGYFESDQSGADEVNSGNATQTTVP